jgi:hypothetical protein
VPFTLMDAEAGETWTVASGPGVTVNVALPDLPSLVAVIVVVPTADAVATPDDDTVATAVLLDVQVMVRPVSGVPFASFGVAVNVAVEPLAALAVDGATVTVLIGMSATITVPEPDTPSLVAVIVAVPGSSPNTDPDAGLTVATPTLLELQVTTRLVATFPLTSVRTAVNVVLPPVGMLALGGDTTTLATGGTRTFTVTDPDFPSLVAVIVAVPGVPPVTTPVDDTVATVVLLDDHATTRSVTTVPF